MYLDDWIVFSILTINIEVLILMLDRCSQCQISLNLKKCFFFYTFWNFVGPCGMKTRLDVRPCEDHGHNKFGVTKECETVARNVGAYGIL